MRSQNKTKHKFNYLYIITVFVVVFPATIISAVSLQSRLTVYSYWLKGAVCIIVPLRKITVGRSFVNTTHTAPDWSQPLKWEIKVPKLLTKPSSAFSSLSGNLVLSSCKWNYLSTISNIITKWVDTCLVIRLIFIEYSDDRNFKFFLTVPMTVAYPIFILVFLK